MHFARPFLNVNPAGTLTGNTHILDNRRRIRTGAFRAKYNYHVDLSLQPSEHTLNLLVKAHQRRPADFFSLARVAKMMDGRDLIDEPQPRTQLGKDLTVLIETKGSRKTPISTHQVGVFTHSVTVLMMGYAWVSAQDPPLKTRYATWGMPSPIS